MRPIPTAGALVIGLAVLAACADRTNPMAVSDRPLFAGAPADGNGNKQVIPIDLQFPDFVTCEGGAILDLHVVGFIQIRDFSQPNNRNVSIQPFHLIFHYSNAAGDTFVWNEIGPDHFYIDQDGNLIDAVTGRGGVVGGIIGRFVTNTVTGEVEFRMGKPVFANDLACDALT